MSENAKSGLSMVALWALIFSNITYMSDLAVIPAYSTLFTHFADAPAAVTNFIASGSQLTLIVACLLAPVLMRYVSKKILILIGVGCATVACIVNGWVDNATYVATMRGVAGFFMGLSMPCAAALIMECYKDDDEKRTKYTGWFDGSMPMIGCVLLLAAGGLLTFGWNHIFDVFWLGVPIFIWLAVALPMTPPEGRAAVEAAQKAKAQPLSKPMKWGKLVAIFISFTVCNMLYGALVYEFTMYLMENFTIEPWMNGVLGAIKGVAGALMGFVVFVPLFKRAKRFTITICFAAQAVAYFGLQIIFSGAVGILWFLICYSFIGIAFGLSVPYYYNYTAIVFPKEKLTLVTSAVSVAMCLGAFLSTYFVTFLQGILGVTAYTPCMPYIGACCLFCAVLTIICGIKDPDRKEAFAALAAKNEEAEAPAAE